MTGPPTTEETRAIHSAYCQLAKIEHRYSMQTHFMIEAWMAEGYTIEDLRLVIAYIWRRIKAGKRERESFKLSVLIGSLPRWSEDLSMAKSEATIAQKDARRPIATPAKASVLRATGRETERPRRDPDAVAAIVAQCLEKMRRDSL